MKKCLRTKRAFELPFGMIFSIIAGAVIIFLAIYATTRLISHQQETAYSESALAISNLLNPIVNGITSSQATKVKFNKETRLYINCSESSSRSRYFGSQTISFSEESGFLKKWTSPGSAISRNNKYIFSDYIEQGKILNIFSTPLYFGFRVDDLIMLSTEDYCFVAPPEEIQGEVGNLGININITSNIAECNKNSVKVCFGQSSICNINVYDECSDAFCKPYEVGRVSKGNKNLYYTGNLIYAAILSSPEIYECNIVRLGKKTAELARVYQTKIDIVESQGCNSLTDPYLNQIVTLAENLTIRKLGDLNYRAKLMDKENCDNNQCKIYQSENC